MKIVEISPDQLHEAPWNPNQMDESMQERLKESLVRYGLVEPLVVRPKNGAYEVLSGNQRFRIISDLKSQTVPCVVVNLNDDEAMLLAQALNGLRGEDDLALKGELLRSILASIPENEVLSLLPETAYSLRTLSSFTHTDIAQHLEAWEQAQAAKLKHMQLQFTYKQLELVEEAVSRILPRVKDDSFDNPNTRGNAVYLLCRFYLENVKEE
ncbi:MAG TPA: ParB N-terminal domain-containing protein [Dehalococcoidia bacterium]|nr:ParB N-terminal domain-containing protein [Dehalococcoidia bacterium]